MGQPVDYPLLRLNLKAYNGLITMQTLTRITLDLCCTHRAHDIFN
jgi:hypothetical protein